MTKFYYLVGCLIISLGSFSQVSFTPGNLVVYKVGNGTDTLSSAGFQVNIDEFTTAGVFVRSHLLPTSLSGNNKRIIASGSATSEGQITRSVDKRFLVVTGYDTIPDPLRLSISGSLSASVNRVVGILGADGSLDATTSLNDSYSGNNFRGAASTNGNDIWLAGTGTPSSTAGVRYTTKGATTSTQLSTTVTNIRVVNIYNNQLYGSSGSGAFKALLSVGTGIPVITGQTISVINGFPNISASTADPYAFAINPSGNIAYVADNNFKANGGGVQKWIYNTDSLKWKLQYTLDSALTNGIKYLTVDWSGVNPKIYAVNSDPIVKNLPGNKIVSVTDIDSNSQFNILATAGANFVFRGIAFAPEASSSTVYTFTGNGNWSLSSNWNNGLLPPNPLPSNSSVIINPVLGGRCILDISQNINPGAQITINAGKEFLIPGSLNIH